MRKIKIENLVMELLRRGLVLRLALMLISVPFAQAMIFSPPPTSYLDGPGVIKIDVGNGESIRGRYLVNPNAEFTILYNHGNNEETAKRVLVG